ncbi:MAG: alpha/beta hydrolase, partial [Duodenibacillus sp.]|nr:alpha/beta hydrolase [Duodenibacillus sp.]
SDDYGAEAARRNCREASALALFVNGVAFAGAGGGPLDPAAERTRLSSLFTWITPAAPPHLIFHGGADRLVSPSQTERLHAALAAAGVASERWVVPGAGHGGAAWQQPAVCAACVDFLRRTLG